MLHHRFGFLAAAIAACTPVDKPVLDGIPPAWTQVPLPDAQVAGPDWRSSPSPGRAIPKLGTVTLTSDKGVETWETVDFSSDVIDLSAEFMSGTNTLSITGYDSGDLLLEGAGLISLTATFAQPTPGTTSNATMFIAGQYAEDVVELSQPDFQVTLDTLTPDTLDERGFVAGSFAGTLCTVPPTVPRCRKISANFATRAWVPD